MPTGAVIGAGVLGAGASIVGNNRAVDAQTDASNASIAEQRRQFDTILGLTAPQRNVSNSALNVLGQAFIPGFTPYQDTRPPSNSRFYGQGGGYGDQYIGLNPLEPDFTLPNPNTPNAGNALTSADLSTQFQNLPGAQFLVDESMRNIGNSFAARGGALSGNALRAIDDRSRELTNTLMIDRLFGLAGLGQQGTNIAASSAANSGNNISNALINQGNARASGIAGTTQSVNNAIQGGLSNYLLLQQLSGT